MSAIIPSPKVTLSFRAGTINDVPFMDALQKKYGKALGFWSTKMFEEYIALGAVLIAESKDEGGRMKDEGMPDSSFIPHPSSLRLGYIISRDRYLKRDELGIVYQICVVPGVERGYVGAALLREVFERSAYGCRLYCCWCAQDLPANRFWEAMGFVPVAFRAGSDRKRRVHIFWQKKIVEGDAETKWWYPFQTNNGAIRADRLVFPIPEGTHWSEVKAVELPGNDKAQETNPKRITNQKPKIANKPKGLRPMGGFKFASETPAKVEKTAKPRAAKAKEKIDPKYLAGARELRDRYLEFVNAKGRGLLPAGKYDVARALPAASPRLLPAA